MQGLVDELEKRLSLLREHIERTALTVHLAYHTDERGTWLTCNHRVCKSSAFSLSQAIR